MKRIYRGIIHLGHVAPSYYVRFDRALNKSYGISDINLALLLMVFVSFSKLNFHPLLPPITYILLFHLYTRMITNSGYNCIVSIIKFRNWFNIFNTRAWNHNIVYKYRFNKYIYMYITIIQRSLFLNFYF